MAKRSYCTNQLAVSLSSPSSFFLLLLMLVMHTCREGGGELREPKAKHRHPQVHLRAVPAETPASDEPAAVEGPLQYPQVRRGERPRPPRSRRVLQRTTRDRCTPALAANELQRNKTRPTNDPTYLILHGQTNYDQLIN